MSKYDLYVSFDKDEMKESKWILNFLKNLEFFLERLLNYTPKIINSNSDNVKSLSEKQLVSLLDEMAIAIAVLPITSKKNSSELNAISNCIEKQEREKKFCVFKVLQSLVPIENQPEKLRLLLSYDFFNYAHDTGKIEELGVSDQAELNGLYWSKLYDLAHDIADSLKSMNLENKSQKIQQIIYLGHATSDLSKYRDIIKRELQQFGFKIVPDRNFYENSEQVKKEIHNYLSESKLSIHLLGSTYGDAIKGSDKSFIEFENNVVSEFIQKEKQLPRLVWLPPDLNISDRKQEIYIDELRKDIEEYSNSEIIQTPLEILKTIIRDRVKGLNGSIEDVSKSKKQGVYLIYPKEDVEKIVPIEKHLQKKGLNVLHTDFDNKQSSLIKLHKKNLVNSEAVIIYYTTQNKLWIDSKLHDLIKTPGFGKKESFKAKAIILGKETEFLSKELDQQQFIVVSESTSDIAKSITPFVEKIKKQ